MFKEVVEEGYFGDSEKWQQYLFAMRDLNFEIDTDAEAYAELEQSLLVLLTSGNRVQRVGAALTCMTLAFRNSPQFPGALPLRESSVALAEGFRPLRDALAVLVCGSDSRIAFAATWALVWAAAVPFTSTPSSALVLRSLYRLWSSESGEFSRFASWAFGRQPLLPRDTFATDDFPNAHSLYDTTTDNEPSSALIVLAWYRRAPWSDVELLSKISQIKYLEETPIFEILDEFGPAGESVLEEVLNSGGHVAHAIRTLLLLRKRSS